VQELQKAYEQVVSEYNAQSNKFNELTALAHEVADNGITDLGNAPHIDAITASWNQLGNDINSRRDTLAAELQRQESNESLRQQFAASASELNALIQEQSAGINAVSGALEEQLKNVQARKPTINSGQEKLHRLEELHRQLEHAGVTSNPHTHLNFATIKVDYEQLLKIASNKESLIQNEIIKKSNSSVSAEQVAEFKEVFEHFDKDRTGTLSRLEFKSCLQSLGEDLPDAELDAIIANIGSGGRVPFQAFVNFMSKKAADSDTKDQILEAFKTIAGDKEFITEEELRRVLPAEKVAYLTSHMPLYKGQAGTFDYSHWAGSAFN